MTRPPFVSNSAPPGFQFPHTPIPTPPSAAVPRPPFVSNSAPPGFQFPHTPTPTPPSAAVPSASGQFNGGGVRGWEGPAPALGLPVGGFGMQSEVLGMPASFNGAAIHQPWTNLCPQGGLRMFTPASGIPLGTPVQPPFQTDQVQALQNPVHPSLQSQNFHQQGGHATSPAVGAPISGPIGHINPQNHHPYPIVSPGQYMNSFETQPTQHTGSAILPQQQWPSSNPASQISNGVPVGRFCSNPPPGAQHWLPTSPANNVVNGIPAGNFLGNPPCRPNGTQQQHSLPDTPSHVFTGAPAGNFHGSPPCRPIGPQQQCAIPNTAHNVFNGTPAPNFHTIPPRRPSGVQQQCPLPETANHVFNGANHVFNGVTAGNLYSNSPCRPNGTQHQGSLPETGNCVVNGVPAANFESNSPCRPSGVQQHCPRPVGNFHSSSPCRPVGEQQSLANTANCVFSGVPAGNFHTSPSCGPSTVSVNSSNIGVSYSNSPCRPNGTQHQGSLTETANCVVNGVPAASFESNSPCRPSGVQQHCPIPVGNFHSSSPCRPVGEQQSLANTANCVFNGVPAGNFHTSPSCRPSTVSVNGSNNGVSVPHIGQLGPQQQIYHAVDNMNTISVNNRSNAQEPPNLAGTPVKAQPNGQPREAVNMGTHAQQYDQSNKTWGRGRGDLANRMPQIRNGAVWQGGKNIQSNTVHTGRGGGWRERIAGGDYRQRVPFKCEPCDRTFSNRHKMEAHKLAHVKCIENDCNYEAAGKLVTEHMLMVHSKKPASSANPRRSALFLSKDAEDEIRRWREERRKNYPITSNIQRKAQEALARKMRGELVDEDACRRKERLREILAKQAELGVPVAEVPAHYISDTIHGTRNEGMMRQGSINGKRAASDLSRQNSDLDSADKMQPAKIARKGRCSKSNNQRNFGDVGMSSECNESPSSPDRAISATKINDNVVNGTSNLLQTYDNNLKQDVEAGKKKTQMSRKLCHYFQRGKCRKGGRCPFLHERKQKKILNEVGVPAESGTSRRQPTLLAKLLDGDIRKEKSHLLQCFRFFVNNHFLAELPEVALKFFSWADTDLPSDIKESVAAFRLPESSNFSDADSEGQVQSETSMLDEPNLRSFINKRGSIPKSDMLLEDDGGSETEIGTSDSETLWTELKHRIMDDAKVGEMAGRSSSSLAV